MIDGSSPTPTGDIDRENPWPGLSSFTEATQGFFFGRDRETDELSRLVRRETLTVLFGQSGLGKSSLLQAGLFPILRESDHLPLYLRLDHNAEGSLADQVKTALAAAFATAKADAPAIGADESLWEYFHRKDVDIWSAKNQLLTPVLAFDQFEEIFTLGRADDARRERSRAFLTELADLVENRAPAPLKARFENGTADPARYNFDKPSCRVILSLREDFLPDLEGLKQELPALIHNRLRLKRLNGAQGLEAVTRPAPHLLAEGVGEKIVEFVSGSRGGSSERLLEMEVEPALLSVICRELNERRRSLGQDKITADLVSGNRREILNDFYERSVADLPEAMRIFIEDHLLTKSGFRDNLALETALEYRGVARPLIDTLVARRLLRVEERAGIQRVELTHDVLADVVRASRDSRQQRLAITHSARRTRRMRFAIAGLVAVVIALSVGAVFGIRAQVRSAQQGGQTDLILGSRILDEGKLSEGLAYLVRAGRKDPANPIVAPRLLTALTSRNYMLPVGVPLEMSSPAVGGTFSADERWLVYQGEDNVVRYADATRWKLVRELSFERKVRRGGITMPQNNPATFAVVLEDNQIVICDTSTGRPRVPPVQPSGKLGGRYPRFAFSPDGRWLAAMGATEVWIWDATTGQLRATRPADGFDHDFAFSPDSQKIAINYARTVEIWSLEAGSPVGQTVEAPGTVAYCRFSGDGKRLLIWQSQGMLVCDAESGSLVRPTIPLSWFGISEVWFTPHGDRIVYVGTDRTANTLDVATGKPVYPPMLHGGNVLEGALVANGTVLFTNSVDGYFRLWDLETGKLLAEPTLKQRQYSPAAVSRDGKTVVLFSLDGPAYRLRLGGGPTKPLAIPRTRATTLAVNLAQGDPARLMWMTPREVIAIDIASGRVAKGGFRFPEPLRTMSRSTFGATLGSGDVITVETEAGQRRAWTIGEAGVTNDVELADAPSLSSFIESAVHRVGMAVPTAGGGLGIWDTQTGRRIALIPTTGTLRLSLTTNAFSPDGKRVAFQTVDDPIIHVCEITPAKELFTLQLTGRASLNSIRFSPDGKRLLSGDTWGAVQIWDPANGKMLRSTQRHRTAVTRFDYSSHGRVYASLSTDGSVQVWDAATDQPIGALMEQNGAAGRADFSPDNTRIITPSNRGSARVWDAATGLPLTDPLLADEEPVAVVAFSADGRFLDAHPYVSVAAQSVRLWSAPPRSSGRTPDWLLTLATICAGHRLTDDGKLLGATQELAKIEAVQRALADLPATDPYAEWARWFLSDSPTRPIGPGFTITPAEAKKLRTDFVVPVKAPPAASASVP